MSKIIQLFKLNEDYSKRVFGLDILRFLAIFFVLHDHGSRFVPNQLLNYYNILRFDGVGIFFVLSGFLIGGIFLKQLDCYKFDFNFLFDFWIRRWMRTLPNYFLFLVFLLILYKSLYTDFSILNKLNYFIFFQNINSGELDFFGESWSLAVEEWFYITLPLLMFVFNFVINSKRLTFFLSSIIVLGICHYFRQQLYINNSDYVNFNHSVLGRLDSIFWGVLGAFLYKNFLKYWLKFRFLALILSLIILFVTNTSLLSIDISVVYKSTITSMIVFLLLPYFSELKNDSKKMYVNFITYISLISYSIYLVNSQISNLLVSFLDYDKIVNLIMKYNIIDSGVWSILLLLNFFLFFMLTILCSTLIYKYYEVPMTRLRDLPFFKNKFKKTRL